MGHFPSGFLRDNHSDFNRSQAIGVVHRRVVGSSPSHTAEQKELVRFTPNARYAEIDSIHGHDAFLIEFDQLNAVIKNFL